MAINEQKSQIESVEVDDWSLNTEQMIFMLQNHNPIESAYEAVQRGDDRTFHKILDDIQALPEYKAAFGDMSWDEAYDRYESMIEDGNGNA